MESQQFCLRWHNFQNTLLSSLPKLLDGGHLTDVTLSAGGRHIHAHRIILSACSYYFKELFKDLSSLQHPIIVLPAMADTLHICGLADMTGKNSRHDNGLYTQPPIMPQEKLSNEDMIMTESKDNTTITESESVSASLHEVINNLDDEEPSNDQESIPYCVKTKPYYSINAKLNQREKTSASVNISVNKYLDKGYSEGIADETASMTEDQITPLEDIKPPSVAWDGNFKLLAASAPGKTSQTYNKSSVTCFICGKQLSNQYNLRVHMETHSNSSYSCTSCSHVSRSRDALRKHVSYRHPVASSQKRPRYTSKPPL
ncbi:zinc finger protein 131 isoform X2 [Cataglyphis hispanica]|uniref:zinc finger protein 131 isoform X2 n=1 Tax=Cataglyphis hispanica TaxID=1086592 RepID=UPI00217FFA98|nr:zinc finger protein 131 isoform X2 [Cataglyphis hispanica]